MPSRPSQETGLYDAAWLFWQDVHFTIATIRDVGSRAWGLFMARVKKDRCGRNVLSGLRLTLNFFRVV